jgi:hypothetical protein
VIVRRHRGVGECAFFARVFVSASPVYSFSSTGSVAGGTLGVGMDTSTLGGLGGYGGGRSVDGSAAMAREGVQVVGTEEIQIYTGSLTSWKDSPVRDLTK